MSSRKVLFLFFVFAMAFYFLPGFVEDHSSTVKDQWRLLPARIDKIIEVLKTKF